MPKVSPWLDPSRCAIRKAAPIAVTARHARSRSDRVQQGIIDELILVGTTWRTATSICRFGLPHGRTDSLHSARSRWLAEARAARCRQAVDEAVADVGRG